MSANVSPMDLLVKRRERKVAPTLVLRKDFRNELTGVLAPGTTLRIVYDADRVFAAHPPGPEGADAWTFTAFLRFRRNGDVREVELVSQTGDLAVLILEPSA